jgi:hypothetical protein
MGVLVLLQNLFLSTSPAPLPRNVSPQRIPLYCCVHTITMPSASESYGVPHTCQSLEPLPPTETHNGHDSESESLRTQALN